MSEGLAGLGMRGVEPEVRAIAWKAQHRLHSRLNKLLARGKPANLAVTAVARELLWFHLGDCPARRC